MTQAIDWTHAMSRYKMVRSDPDVFSEQTVVHLAMASNGAVSLDPQRFVLSRADEFEMRDICDPDVVVLRHYVGPVRHKMWNMASRMGILG
jgi:hypothetical protein